MYVSNQSSVDTQLYENGISYGYVVKRTDIRIQVTLGAKI